MQSVAIQVIEALRVIDLYPLMRDLLNLPPVRVDGDPQVLRLESAPRANGNRPDAAR